MELYPTADRPRTQDAEHAGVDEGGWQWKALTLRQPWATLVALGVKTVETRSWPTSYRGPLVIHAAKRRPVTPGRLGAFGVGWHRIEYFDHVDEGYTLARTDGRADKHGVTINPCWRLPLGGVVATCTLVDVVPTEALYWTALWPRWAWQDHGGSPLYPPQLGLPLHESPVVVPVEERPLGDFSPGRYAWLLSDVKMVDPPEPAKGRQGLWTLERVDQ